MLGKTLWAERRLSKQLRGGAVFVNAARELASGQAPSRVGSTALPAVGARDELFFSNPADTGARDRMTVRRSDDGGRTNAGPSSARQTLAFLCAWLNILFSTQNFVKYQSRGKNGECATPFSWSVTCTCTRKY
mgnify:CR=1 FL=1